MIKKLWLILIATLFALFLIVLILIVGLSVHGQESRYRYLKLEGTFQFSYSDDLPYEAIRAMCWNDFYCDVPLENVYRLYYVVDFDTQLYSVVMHADAGCFVYTLRQEMGSDNQPHLATVPNWIVCS